MKLYDLEVGKHVVEFKNGERMLYLKGYFVGVSYGRKVVDFNDNMVSSHDEIIKVYEITDLFLLRDIINKEDTYLNLVWDKAKEIKNTKYLTFDEARKTGKRMRADGVNQTFLYLSDILMTLSNFYTAKEINEIMDSKLWEVEQSLVIRK